MPESVQVLSGRKKQNQSVVILGDLGMALPKNRKEAGQARRPADHWKV
jgi:hypothetical protein